MGNAIMKRVALYGDAVLFLGGNVKLCENWTKFELEVWGKITTLV
jgi:hypothetical protein